MRAFEYIAPKSAEAAVAALAEHAPNARLLGGGTDLLVDLKHTTETPKMLVDVSRIEDFKGIEVTDAGVRIGSMVTHSELMASPIIQENFPAMVDAAHTVGAVQTRNLGTLGGNLVTCVPSMDSGPALLALDATVTVAGPDGSREMPLGEFFVAPRKTIMEPNELLVDVRIPAASMKKPTHFLKFGLRKGQALALVNVAGGFWVSDDNKFVEPRITLGAVAPTVIRAHKAEEYLAGRAIDVEAMAEAGRIAVTEAKPIDDFRASAEYRCDLIAVLTRRALEGALEMAQAA